MTIKVAITGFGRIGRNILRARYESDKWNDVEIVAINAMGSLETNAFLLKHDTVHGHFCADVKTEVVSDDEKYMIVNGDRMRVFCERDPKKLPWAELGVDVVLECTGAFRSKESCLPHLESGAKKVLISAPGKEVDATVVYGVNHDVLTADMTVVSNASCTTNCLAPVVKPLHDALGVVNGLMTTVHAYTNDQRILDLPHKDLRRARAAGQSIIPTTTGAARAVALVLPELKGKLNGFAMRVPTPNVSVVDLVAELEKPATADEINAKLKEAAEGELKGVLGYTDEPLVSKDFCGNANSSIVDGLSTMVIEGNMVKVVSWYDNEWGYSNRVLDLAAYIASKGL